MIIVSDTRELIVLGKGEDPDTNHSGNPTFQSIVDRRYSRREVLQGGIGLAVAAGFWGGANSALAAFGSVSPRGPAGSAPTLAFDPVAITRADQVTVPAGYTASAFIPWGTPIVAPFPAYQDGGLNSGADQEAQIGMHHDGMYYFPLFHGPRGNRQGLLCINHEYIQPNTIHANGPTLENGVRTIADEVRKEVAAHGVTVVEIQATARGEWDVVRGRYNRRITAGTPMEITGPVRGNDLVKTLYSPDGTATRGTVNNCAYGSTPWGTYLTCEENWAGYFVNDGAQPREHSRYGVSTSANHSRYFWHTVAGTDEYVRFNATPTGGSAIEDYRNEPNSYGWVVEIDPFDPTSTPKKHTALGRFGHEGAWLAPALQGQPLVCYMGDDANNEYIYKYVSKQRYFRSTAGSELLDDGTLYVARFNDDGSGDWLALDINDPAFLAAAAGVEFKDQADVLVNARLAADVVGATRMDRPEWGTVHPKTREVYMTLTNNTRRAADAVNAANPRGPNPYGHIIRWREEDNRSSATRFQWDIFVLAGPESDSRQLDGAALDSSNIFASPDGLWIDQFGTLWIQTDMSGSQLNSGPFGNNQMLVANPQTGDIQRFFVGPVGCEVTGVVSTPDGKTLFVNIQHPGEQGAVPDGAQYSSSWPDGGSARPRAATVIVTKDDGGVVGL